MKIKIILLSLSMVAVASGSALAESKSKPSSSQIIRPPAEKKLDGIPRPTDKDHNPSEPFHIARTPAEKRLDEITLRAIYDRNTREYVLGRPRFDAKDVSIYSRLFTKKFVQVATKKEADLVKKTCGGKYDDGLCGMDHNPITCSQDFSDSGYLYRTVEDDGHKAIILSLGVDVMPSEIQTSYRLIKDGSDWKIDGISCGGGGGLNMDCSNAVCAEDVPYFQKKGEDGSAEAQYDLGIIYSLGRGVKWNEAEAAKWFHKAAEQGHADAQAYLGYIYYSGNQGVKQNKTESAKWYRKAAEQGHANAQYHLGDIYEVGRGVTKDEGEAEKWFRKAAEQGQVLSQYHLGSMYEEGRGVPKNDAEALKWYRKAAEKGHLDAKKKIEELGQR